MKINVLLFCLLILVSEMSAITTNQDYWHGVERSIRYRPDGKDFIITNGDKRFNRALYGGNTAFRVEAGDLPEFALYLPGMGGNFRFGVISKDTSKWLIDSDQITARYCPGAMIYEINDPLFGDGIFSLTILAMYDAEGAIIKIDLDHWNNDLDLVWVFGGASNTRFNRNGDLGADPESSFYLKPEYCDGNEYTIGKNTFSLTFAQKSPFFMKICGK